MAGIQLSGLASGLDWRSLVDQLVAAERTPQNALRTEKGLNLQKSSSLETLQTNLTSLQTALKAMSSDTSDVFAARTAKIASADTGWSATATGGTEAGNYRVAVTQLATKSQRTGVGDRGASLSATSDVSGVTLGTMRVAKPVTAGDFTVNGAKVTVALTDSLQDLFTKISTATGGAVSASYDPALDKVRLSSSSEIVLGAANDTSNLLLSLGLVNNGSNEVLPPKALGVVSLNAAIANANLRDAVTAADAGGNGTFSINGVAIDYNVNSDSLSTIVSRINASSAGVVASYDKLNDRFILANKTTGDTGLAVSEAPGGLLAALGVDGAAPLTRGKNAEFSIDGGPTLTSASNSFDASAHGIAGLTINATSETTQTVSVAGDVDGARGRIDEFIKQFNAVQSYIEAQTKTTTGANGKVSAATLASNREVTDISKSLRNKIFNAVPGLSGAITRLESLGIDFKSGTAELAVKDSAKLDAALRNNGEQVKTLFSSKPDGLVARLDAFITKVTGSTGTLTTQTESFAKQNKGIDEQIAAMDRRIAQQKAQLESSFIHMEEAQSNIQRQLAALTNSFGGSSSSK